MAVDRTALAQRIQARTRINQLIRTNIKILAHVGATGPEHVAVMCFPLTT